MKSLCLLILFTAPMVLWAQPEIQNGSLIFDFGKNRRQKADSTRQQTVTEEQLPEDTVIKPKRERKPRPVSTPGTTDDYKKNGIFSGLFHAGVNACQIDGDKDWGYKYLGADVGVGALARFHPILSVSLELNYSMRGAKQHWAANSLNPQLFQIQWDYVEAAVALNAHYKDLLMISLGLAPGYMVRYKELLEDGTDVTSNPPLGRPNRFDLMAYGAAHIIFKKHYSLGVKFAYSTIKIREPYSGTKVNGQYNNVIGLSFMYLLTAVKHK